MSNTVDPRPQKHISQDDILKISVAASVINAVGKLFWALRSYDLNEQIEESRESYHAKWPEEVLAMEEERRRLQDNIDFTKEEVAKNLSIFTESDQWYVIEILNREGLLPPRIAKEIDDIFERIKQIWIEEQKELNNIIEFCRESWVLELDEYAQAIMDTWDIDVVIWEMNTYSFAMATWFFDLAKRIIDFKDTYIN